MGDGLPRRLVAVMFTDIAGYTALMQADERDAVEKRDLYVDALRREHDAAGGSIVQLFGDGSLSMFPSALAAVSAAVAMQRALAPASVPVRIGIHVGDVLVEPDRLTGDAVNIAARVESFAVPGSVLVSDTAYEQIRNRPEIEVAALGSFRLKNVTRPLEFYAVSGPDLVVPDRSALEGKGEVVVAFRASLPRPSTELLGRDRELDELAELVQGHRVVRSPGPAGRQDAPGDGARAPLGTGVLRWCGFRGVRGRDGTSRFPTRAGRRSRREGGRGAIGRGGDRRAGGRAPGAAPARQSRADSGRGPRRGGPRGGLAGTTDRGDEPDAPAARRRAALSVATASHGRRRVALRGACAGGEPRTSVPPSTGRRSPTSAAGWTDSRSPSNVRPLGCCFWGRRDCATGSTMRSSC